ncbi:MAG: hypothetical protein J6D87_09295 [Clostridia bacterium]|nr:hypothetical protein [Clostridia bacterium]
MTFKSNRELPDAPAPRQLHVGEISFGLLCGFCFLLVLRNSEAAVKYMGRGLSLCAETVIPSLFPFMVLSELLVASGAGEALGRLLAKPMKWLFGLSGAGCSAVVLGSMCGFPIGASTAVALYDKNVISKRECEHLLTFSNHPSSAFLVTAVGVSLFQDRRLGLILYLVVLGSAFFMGFILRFFLRGKECDGASGEHPHFPSGLHPGGITMLTDAVSHAAVNMLTVSAYVVFFSALTGVIATALSDMGHITPTLFACICGFFELSGGVSASAGLATQTSSVLLPIVLTAMIAGWSGLSVHCQILSLCGGRGLSFKPYFIAKALQSILCGLLMWGILSVMDPADLPKVSETVATLLPRISSFGILYPFMTVTSHIGLILGTVLCLARRFSPGSCLPHSRNR